MKTYTIPIECPEGWEPVAFRVPKDGEWFVDALAKRNAGRQQPLLCADSSRFYYSRLIVRRKFVWPDWINPGMWLAKDANGVWWAHEQEPAEDGWSSEGRGFRVEYFEWFFSGLELPDVPWEQSKMQKPVESEE